MVVSCLVFKITVKHLNVFFSRSVFNLLKVFFVVVTLVKSIAVLLVMNECFKKTSREQQSESEKDGSMNER